MKKNCKEILVLICIILIFVVSGCATTQLFINKPSATIDKNMARIHFKRKFVGAGSAGPIFILDGGSDIEYNVTYVDLSRDRKPKPLWECYTVDFFAHHIKGLYRFSVTSTKDENTNVIVGNCKPTVFKSKDNKDFKAWIIYGKYPVKRTTRMGPILDFKKPASIDSELSAHKYVKRGKYYRSISANDSWHLFCPPLKRGRLFFPEDLVV